MDISQLAIVLGVILVSMTLHEVMHGFVAYYLGDNTARDEGRLTLNPLKHIDPFLTILLPLILALTGGPIFGGAKPVPFNPSQVRHGEWGVALVGVVGPLTNLFLAFVAFGAGVLTGVITDAGVLSSLGGQIVWLFISVNLGFFVFNMLPIPPLDGSRVLYAIAPDFLRNFLAMIERGGLILIFGLVLVASTVIGGIMTTVIGFALDIFSKIFGIG